MKEKFKLEDGALLESLKVIDDEIQAKPNSGKLYNNKGVMLLQLKKSDQALLCFEKALE
jgi:tetratricopeptide (TPR) repeat protein